MSLVFLRVGWAAPPPDDSDKNSEPFVPVVDAAQPVEQSHRTLEPPQWLDGSINAGTRFTVPASVRRCLLEEATASENRFAHLDSENDGRAQKCPDADSREDPLVFSRGRHSD